MRLVTRRFVLISLTAAGLSPLGLAMAQGRPEAKSSKESVDKDVQRVEGVILKAKPFAIRAAEGSKIHEAVDEGRQAGSRYRLTINTAIPWVDYVRDESVDPDKVAKNEKPAPKTKESVATEGQPAATPSETLIDITPATKIELRYRSSTDESDDGAATVEAAEELQRDPAEKASPSNKSRRDAAKPAAIEADDLRVGQYVIVEYRRSISQNPATKIIVLKPIGGADTSAKDEATKSDAVKKP